MNKPYIIGISGGSGSGKTTFIKELIKTTDLNKVTFISLDHYYKTQDQQPLDHNGIPNYDLPESIDIDTFMSDLTAIIDGETIQKKEYNFNNPALKTGTISLKPASLIIIEGIFLFHYTQLMPFLNLKIYIETDEHLRIKRRILRDLEERGYPLDDTLYFLEHHVTPGHSMYVEPYKSSCDFIIPNNKNFEKALEVVTSFIFSKIDKMK